MNTALIYDQECPACCLYTKAFVKTGLMDQNERISFSELTDSTVVQLIDWNKARNEIPFADTENKKVYYGVDALLHILSRKSAFFSWFRNQNTLIYLSKKLYSFISYNRRVIIPSKKTARSSFLAPAFNAFYRTIFLLFTWLLVSLVLSAYAGELNGLIKASGVGREFLICGGQIIVQSIVLLLMRKNKEQVFEYLGNMMTISFAGSIVLLPGLLVSSVFFPGMPVFAGVYFAIVATLMFLEHIRRSRLCEFPAMMSVTWLLYRIVLLVFLMNP